MTKLRTNLSRSPLFLVLLPLFFAFHGFAENLAFLPYRVTLVLLVRYLLVALGLALLGWLTFRDRIKAALFAFALLSYELFFGSAQDFLKKTVFSFLTRYSIVIPVSALALVLLVWVLYRNRNGFPRTVRYLNVLFLVLIAVDLGHLLIQLPGLKRPHAAPLDRALASCPSCNKPDIYLILADEYAGKQELKELFQYDNSPFEQDLRSRGFEVVENSRSNYNYSVYSMSSLFNLSYLENLYDPKTPNYRDIVSCQKMIAHNRLGEYLKGQGYELYNHSFFDFAGEPRSRSIHYFPDEMPYFIAQTFTKRIQYDLGFHWVSAARVKSLIWENVTVNEAFDSMTRKIATIPNGPPRFVYTHLLLPHHPYFFDQNGNRLPENRLAEWHTERFPYLDYLKYANKRLLSLIDSIRTGTSRPAVILLLSDHGYREYNGPFPNPHHFMNLNAVLLPGGARASFYQGMSNVNIFRVLLNQVFRQNLPLLPDSTHFLKE